MAGLWLMKSEPDVYAWDDLVREGTGHWDGVRNYQARNHMKEMKVGDLSFFYHSNIGREIVGIMEIVRAHYPDPADPRFVQVDVRPHKKLLHPVTLATIKETAALADMGLIRQSRLSVMPVTQPEWDIICGLGR